MPSSELPRRQKRTIAYVFIVISAVWLGVHFLLPNGIAFYSRPPLNPSVAIALELFFFYAIQFGWILPLVTGIWILLRRT